jgi:hypothetical protein
MPSRIRAGFRLKPLICAALAVLGASSLAAAERPLDSIGASFWIESPYRDFRSPRPVLAGRALLYDEADDPVLAESVAAELRRVQTDTFARQGWRSPFPEGETLRVYVTRREADGLRTLSARAVEGRRLIGPAILLDGSGLTDRQITREVSRLVHRAILGGYGAPDSSFVTEAAAELLSGPRDPDGDAEASRIAAAGAELELRAHARALGRLYVEEFLRSAGGSGLRSVFERAGETGEDVLSALLRAFTEATGESEERLLLRFGVRLYASLETEPAPARIGVLDLQNGAFDASAPAGLVLRHRALLPADQAAALRVRWPEDGGAAAAVVRYRDPALPPDVLYVRAGQAHTVPLAGVSRVDWVVAGERQRTSTLRAPAQFEALSDFPFSGLSPQATASADGVRLSWATGSHAELAGWAVFREELLSDGKILRSGPQVLPSSLAADESFRYAFLDTAAVPGVYYRYTVWAVTSDGLLARAFSATLRTAD